MRRLLFAADVLAESKEEEAPDHREAGSVQDTVFLRMLMPTETNSDLNIESASWFRITLIYYAFWKTRDIPSCFVVFVHDICLDDLHDSKHLIGLSRLH